MLKDNLESVEERILAACKRSGRDRSEVTLISVSKTKPSPAHVQRSVVTFHVANIVTLIFVIPKFEYMRNWLRCITVVRNICAHHARLWNANIVVKPNLPNRLPNQWITNRQVAPDKLYPHLCYIAYWLNSINPANTFIKDIKSLLAKYPAADPAAMGFPRGYQNEPLWQ